MNRLVQFTRAIAAIGVCLLFGGAVPWPEPVAHHVHEMEEMCHQVHGVTVEGPTIEHGHLVDGPEFWTVDEAGFQCRGAESLFAGSFGSQVSVYIPLSKNPTKPVFNSFAYGLSIEHVGDQSKLWIAVGGDLCGQTGKWTHGSMIGCERSLKWDADSETLKYAPLSEARFSSPVNEAGQSRAQVLYDSGSELINAKSGVFQSYWRDQAHRIDWVAPVSARGVIYNGPLQSNNDRALLITMLQAPQICDPLCPVRVFTADHRKIMEFAASDDRSQHEVSSDRTTLFACGIAFHIPQASADDALMERTPPGVDRQVYLSAIKEERARNIGRPKPVAVISAFHNKSQVMISEWRDGTIEITYDVPRTGLPVAPGTLLFRGKRQGDRLFGLAYMFKNGCPAAPFDVVGLNDSKNDRIVLTGVAPHRDGHACELMASSSMVAARLVFDTKEYGDY